MNRPEGLFTNSAPTVAAKKSHEQVSRMQYIKGAFMSASKATIGYVVQLSGIGALVLGAVSSVHHVAIAAAFLGGAAAFYIGEKIRTLA
jgi:hypothetical protein